MSIATSTRSAIYSTLLVTAMLFICGTSFAQSDNSRLDDSDQTGIDYVQPVSATPSEEGTSRYRLSSDDGDVEDLRSKGMVLQTRDQYLKAGAVQEIWFTGADQLILGYQFTLHADPSKIVIEDILFGVADRGNFGQCMITEGKLTASWFRLSAELLSSREQQFGLRVRVLEEGYLSDALRLSSDQTTVEAYGPKEEPLGVYIHIGEPLFDPMH